MWSGLETEIHGVATGLSLVSTNLEKLNQRVERYIGATSHLTEEEDDSATVFALGLINGLKQKLRTLDVAPKAVVEDSSHLAKEAERSNEVADVACCGAALSSILVVYEALSRHYSECSSQMSQGVQTFKQVKATVVSTVASLPPPEKDSVSERRELTQPRGGDFSPPPSRPTDDVQEAKEEDAPQEEGSAAVDASPSHTKTVKTVVVKRKRKKRHADPAEDGQGADSTADAPPVGLAGGATLSAQLASQQQQQATEPEKKSSIDAWREELGTPTPKGPSPDNSTSQFPQTMGKTSVVEEQNPVNEEQQQTKKSRGFLGAGVALVTAPFRGAKKVATVVANPGESMKEAHLSTFRKKFPHIAEGSSDDGRSGDVIDITNCAWKENKVLKQGHWFLTRTHIAFVSSVLSGEFSIPLREIQKIEKKKNAVVFDNSIEITTLEGETFFITSFIKRDDSFRLLHGLWTNA